MINVNKVPDIVPFSRRGGGEADGRASAKFAFALHAEIHATHEAVALNANRSDVGDNTSGSVLYSLVRRPMGDIARYDRCDSRI